MERQTPATISSRGIPSATRLMTSDSAKTVQVLEMSAARRALEIDDGMADGLTWIVDPVDGTGNFAGGTPVIVSAGAEQDYKITPEQLGLFEALGVEKPAADGL